MSAPSWLYGCWRLERAEAGAQIAPGTEMDFRAGGELLYAIAMEGRLQRFTLRFRVEGDRLHTQHGANAHVATAGFGRTDAGLLEVDFSGRRAWFVRVSQQ